MRYLALLFVFAGAVAAPAFSQSANANLAGTWVAKIPVGQEGGPVSATLTLKQDGTVLSGKQEITRPNSLALLNVRGQVMGPGAAYLEEASVQSLLGITNYCLQAADLRLVSADILAMQRLPNEHCSGTSSFIFQRSNAPSRVVTPSQPVATAPKPAYLTDNWVGTIPTRGGPLALRLSLAQQGPAISGIEVSALNGFGSTLRLSGEVTGKYTALLRETSVQEMRGMRQVCQQSAELTVLSTDSISVQWQPQNGCPAAKVTFTRQRVAAASRSTGIDPRQLLLWGILSGIGGGGTSNNTEDDDRRENESYWHFVHEQGCNTGHADDCRAIGEKPPEPPPSDPPNL